MKTLDSFARSVVLLWQLLLVLAVASGLVVATGSAIGGAVGLVVYALAVSVWVKLIQRFLDHN